MIRVRYRFQVFSTYMPSLGMCYDFLIPSIYVVAFESPSHQCWTPKRGKREKERVGRKAWPFKFSGSHFNRREEGSCNNGRGETTIASTSLFACLWWVAAISDHNTDFWNLEDSVLFANSGSCRLCVCFPGTCAHLPCGWGLAMGSCYCAESWNWQKLTIMYHPCLPLEVINL